MRILYIVTRELSYPRNDVLLRAFQRFANVDIVGYQNRSSLLRRSIECSLNGLMRARNNRYDLVFIGFYGHIVTMLVTALLKKPLLFDAFISTFDTLCYDRAKYKPSSLVGRMAFTLDKRACELATATLLDTPQHVQYFNSTFNLSPTSLFWLPVGCNESLFYPRDCLEPAARLRVLYYCSYLPLHGVEVVLQAANYLRDLPIDFRLIGTGPEYEGIRKMARELELSQVEFVSTLPLSQLPAEIAGADVCLGGHFGSSAKASRVVPGKIYQILAMGRPLIAADTDANRTLLSYPETGWFCAAGNPTSLAEVIKAYYFNPDLRKRIQVAGRKIYLEKLSEQVITRDLHSLVQTMI